MIRGVRPGHCGPRLLPDKASTQRARVLHAVYEAGSASQRGLAHALRLSSGSVSMLCRQLIASGALEVAGTEVPPTGRPAALLRLAPSAGGALGISVTEREVSAVRLDLAEQVVDRMTRPLGPCHDDAALLAAITAAADSMLATADGAGPLFAIGVALSGVVDHSAGIFRFCNRLPGPQDVPLKRALEEQFAVHVAIDDRARTLAIAEHRYGIARGVRDFLFVVVDSGAGAGLFLSDRPYRGTRGLAGEIGHLVVDPAGPWCSCGKRGCLETLVTQDAIERQAREVTGAAGAPTLGAVAERARLGDQVAIRTLTHVGEWLGDAIATALNLFGVEFVVLGGTVPLSSSLVVEAARRAASLQSAPSVNPTIERTALDADAAARGAASLALDELLATDQHGLAQRDARGEHEVAS